MPAGIPHVKVTLDNGLDVIVHEDHHCPIVAVNVWYHVGSKDERPGRTGFAHLFEHLMFEGSEHHDGGYFRPLQEAGGTLNGSTGPDRTNYWEVVPRGALERALWMESDRMGYLLPALTREKLDTQRDVVLNERRQSYENRPYGLAPLALTAAHHPAGHPYHWPTIGWPEDVRAADLDDVRAFFRTYYHPANASLAIAGDVTADEAIRLARAHFEEIPAGPPRPPVTAPPPARDRAAALLLEDRVASPRLYLGWVSPPLFGPRDAELDLPRWSWAAASPRGCTGPCSTTAGSPSTSPRTSPRSRSAGSSAWWRRRRRGAPSPSWRRRSARRSPGSPRRARPAPSWSGRCIWSRRTPPGSARRSGGSAGGPTC